MWSPFGLLYTFVSIALLGHWLITQEAKQLTVA